MIIKGFEKLSLSDYPGKVSCVIFTPGCNLACPFCHNRDLVKNSLKLKPISENNVFEYLNKRKGLVDGVVITGGEPTIQKELGSFIKRIKSLGYKVKLDSNGTRPDILKILLFPSLRARARSNLSIQRHPERESMPQPSLTWRRIPDLTELPYIDFLAMDVKTELTDYAYKKFGLKTGVSPIIKSLNLAAKSTLPVELRTTIIPKLHDEKVIQKMAKQLSKIFFGPSPSLRSVSTGRSNLSDDVILGIRQLPETPESDPGQVLRSRATQDSRGARMTRDETPPWPFRVRPGRHNDKVKWYLQTFRPGTCLDEKFNGVKPYSKEEMQKLVDAAKPIFPSVFLR